MIYEVTVYETMGKQFKTVKDAIAHRENLIDEFLGKTPGFQELPYKRRIDFVQSIIDRRHDLIKLLDYTEKAIED